MVASPCMNSFSKAAKPSSHKGCHEQQPRERASCKPRKHRDRDPITSAGRADAVSVFPGRGVICRGASCSSSSLASCSVTVERGTEASPPLPSSSSRQHCGGESAERAVATFSRSCLGKLRQQKGETIVSEKPLKTQKTDQNKPQGFKLFREGFEVV